MGSRVTFVVGRLPSSSSSLKQRVLVGMDRVGRRESVGDARGVIVLLDTCHVTTNTASCLSHTQSGTKTRKIHTHNHTTHYNRTPDTHKTHTHTQREGLSYQPRKHGHLFVSFAEGHSPIGKGSLLLKDQNSPRVSQLFHLWTNDSPKVF